MFKSRIKKLLLGSVLFALLLVSLPFLWRLLTDLYYQSYIYSQTDLPEHRVAVVFGARIYPDGRLSAMLQDRVDTAIQLYQTGKVEKLIMSGDNRFEDYDEPTRMAEYAIQHGVPAEDIQPDYAGRRTYDTCYRAKSIFQLNDAVLITQGFHLPRALFTCRNLGLNVVGVSADLRQYHRGSILWSQTREIPAMSLALVDVLRRQPAPVLGDPISIE
ncbi:ElyC/SanA/YdcF family protein [Anaerolineales bacterium HSG24]|nr:ElyC/SanA/YdcF family protein [Anaerolineales bacterium HSG24]